MGKAKQFLLFSKPKNYHLQFLNGRPSGMYSLRRYCFEAVRADDSCLSYYDYDQYKVTKKLSYMTFSQAVREKIYLQKHLLELYRTGFMKQRGAWQKQRKYYNRFKQDLQEGKELDQYFE